MAIDKVKAYLEQFGIAERIQEFDVSSATVDLAAQALGVRGERIAKTLSFEAADKCILIVMAGDGRVDNRKFKDTFHRKAKMPSAENVSAWIGHEVGGVCPFAIPEDIPVYLDINLKRFKTVYPAAGSSNSAVEMTPEELFKYGKAAGWVDVCKPMPVECAIFDLDGTLANSEPGVTHSVQYALDSFGWDKQPQEFLKKFLGPALDYSFREFCGFDNETALKAVDKYRELYAASAIYEVSPFEGIPELLKELKAAGIKLGVATSKPQKFSEIVLDTMGLTEYLDYVSGPGMDEGAMTKADLIRDVLEHLNMDIDQAIMVGDRHFDIDGARDCGVRTIGVRFGFAPEGELEEAGAMYMADKPEDVKKYII